MDRSAGGTHTKKGTIGLLNTFTNTSDNYCWEKEVKYPRSQKSPNVWHCACIYNIYINAGERTTERECCNGFVLYCFFIICQLDREKRNLYNFWKKSFLLMSPTRLVQCSAANMLVKNTNM
ncbi:hypothetical protein QTP88_013108 [Uroleucon formosanum]